MLVTIIVAFDEKINEKLIHCNIFFGNIIEMKNGKVVSQSYKVDNKIYKMSEIPDMIKNLNKLKIRKSNIHISESIWYQVYPYLECQ